MANGAAKLFCEGTLLVTCIGEIGRVGVLSRPSSANQQITALTFDQSDQVILFDRIDVVVHDTPRRG